MQHRQVINKPKAASLSGGNQVVIFYSQIGNGHDGQVELERLPVIAVVKRNVHAGFCTTVKQTFAFWIGSDYAGKMPGVYSVGNQCPGFSIIFGSINIGFIIAQLVARPDYISAAFGERIAVNAVEHHPLGHPFGRHIFPGFTIQTSAGFGNMNQPIVRTGPEQVFFVRRFGCCENGAVVFHTGIVFCDGPSGRPQFGRVVPRQIRAGQFPRAPAIITGVDMVRGCIEFFRIVGRKENRKIPLKPVFHAFRAMPHRVVGPDVDSLHLFGSMVQPGQETIVTAAINNVIVQGVNSNMTTFAAGGFFPVVLADRSAIGAVQYAQGRVVLLGYINAVGEVIICCDPIILRCRLIVVRAPVVAAIITDLRPAVVGNDHPFGILRSNP